MEGEAKLPRGSEEDWRGGQKGEGKEVGVGDSTEYAEVHTSGRVPWVT